MKLKKTKKIVRMRGSRLHGYAAKKHKGKGNKGGKGMAGTGKRADHKKSWVLVNFKKYFGNPGLKRKKLNLRLRSINVGELEIKFKGEKEAKLSKYKVLGGGEIKTKLTVTAYNFSKQAREKIEKAGGKAIVLRKPAREKNPEPVEDKPEGLAEIKEKKK